MQDDSFFLNLNDRGDFLRQSEPLIMPPVINIYLAGPLTHADSAIQKECVAVRAAVKSAFHNYDYLGIKFHVYDPAEVTAPGTDHTAEEVYITDHKCTVCADLVFFVVTAPSLGVGIEAQLSASATTPRVILRNSSSPSSRMFSGLCTSTIAEIVYDNPMDVMIGLLQKRTDICSAAIESAERRRPHFEYVKNQRSGQKFFMQRVRKSIPIAELAKKTDIPEFWLREIERCPELACTLSIMNIQRIADVLGCTVKCQGQTFELIEHDVNLIPLQLESLENLVRHLNSRKTPFNEDRAFRIWDRYLREDNLHRSEAKKFRSSKGDLEALTEDDWRQLYEDVNLFD